jgi:hypothetical protein
LCLALLFQFGFDLYLFADALMFNHVDGDALTVRGFVHAATVPLLMLSTERSKDWTSKIRISQKAAFHSVTLFASAFTCSSWPASVITFAISVVNGALPAARPGGGGHARSWHTAGIRIDPCQGQGSRRQAFFPLPLRLSKVAPAQTLNTQDSRGPMATGDPRPVVTWWKPGRLLWLREAGQVMLPDRTLEPAGQSALSSNGFTALQVSARQWLDHQSGGISLLPGPFRQWPRNSSLDFRLAQCLADRPADGGA